MDDCPGCRALMAVPVMRTEGQEKRTNRVHIERCRQLMRTEGIDLTVLSPGPNLRYLTGFHEEPGERPLLLFVPASSEPFFLAPELYRDHLQRDSWILTEVYVWHDGEDPWEIAKRALSARNLHAVERVLVDDRLWAMFLLPLQALLPQSGFGLASEVLGPLRLRKSPAEIQILKDASAIADEVFEKLLRERLAGRTEREVASRIEQEMQRLGGESVAFETLVASGPNGALPHHRAGSRRIEEGDVVILDYGCRIDGYHSDITRTVVCGHSSPKVRHVYEVVQRAQEKAVRSVKPGMTAEEVDFIARSEIAASGLGERFIHRTGHGIGLEVHEPPYLVAGDKAELEEGMTFSVEPGVYLPGEFGVRIEDIVLVTEKGAERLNQASRELISVK